MALNPNKLGYVGEDGDQRLGFLKDDDYPWETRIDVIGQNGNDGLHYSRECETDMGGTTEGGDSVFSPLHYRQGDIECIDAIQAALTEDEWRGYIKGNVLKYTWRERYKGGEESLAKAAWYLSKLLDKTR